MRLNQTQLEVVRGSVLEQQVDAIVNAANTGMRGGGGVDGAIHRAAGPGLLEELRQVAPTGAPTSAVVVTGGHLMPVRHLFHTAGPVWHDGRQGEPGLLAACYRNCLLRAEVLGLQSIAFCSISTGIFAYPLGEAAQLALATVRDELLDRPETSLRRVVFAMFQEGEYQAYRSALKHLAPGQRKKHWLHQFQALEKFVAVHGHFQPAPHGRERHLAAWVARQHQRQQAGLLEPAREHALRHLGFPFATPHDNTWERHLAALEEFVARRGAGRMFELRDEAPALDLWLSHVRRGWRKGLLSAEQEHRLVALGALWTGRPPKPPPEPEVEQLMLGLGPSLDPELEPGLEQESEPDSDPDAPDEVIPES